MSTNKSYKLSDKHRNDILTYLEDGRPIRTYGYKMTEDFAKNFLSLGSKEEIEERKKLFTSLPKDKSIVLDGEEIKLEDATGKELTAYAEANGIDLGDAKKVSEKRATVAKTL